MPLTRDETPNSSARGHCGPPRLLPEETAYPSQNTVLLGVVRVVLARNLKNGGEGGGIRVDAVPYPISNLVQGQRLRIRPGTHATAYVLVD